MRAFALLVAVALTPPAQAAPQTAHEIVCDLSGVEIGHVEGRSYRPDRLEPTDAIRLTFRDHDPVTGTATMLINDTPEELSVGVTTDQHAVVYLYEEQNVGKLLVSSAAAPTPEGWLTVASRHAWKDGTMTIKVSAGICRARKR